MPRLLEKEVIAMARPNPFQGEVTRELTGQDARKAEATVGDAGNGADPYGSDVTGGIEPVEADPGRPADIMPDHVEMFEEDRKAAAKAEEKETTAQPAERLKIDPYELP